RLLKMAPQSAKLAGLIQASRVKGRLETSSVFGRESLSLKPSKESALPLWPATHAGPLVRVPVRPLPVASAVVAPVPSSKAYAAAGPFAGGVVGGVDTLATLE